MRIKRKVIEKIKKDSAVRAKLCVALKKAYPTIQNYVNENHELLTTAAALEVIQEHFGLSYDAVIDRQKSAV